MKRPRWGLYLVLAVVWSSGVAWAQNRDTSGTAEEPALVGSYTTGPFTVEEVALQGFSSASVCENTGTWIMDLRRYGWSQNNYPVPGCTVANPAIVGSWRLLEGNVIAFHELQDLGCVQKDATYNWKLAGDTLTLSVIQDPCKERIYFFTAHPWKKVPEGAQPGFR